jgi:hypothetical protein
MAGKRRWLSYSNVMSTLAVVVVLGGGSAYAATAINGNSISNHTIAGKKLVNNTVSGAQVNESTLGVVPNAAHAGTADSATTAGTATTAGSANALTALPSGQSESGNFSGADGGAPAGGWIGVGITYARPLATPIPDANIIENKGSATSTHCSGPGHADAGYLCLYNSITSGTGAGYGYSTETYFPVPSWGVTLYFPVSGTDAYVGGTYTVTAS